MQHHNNQGVTLIELAIVLTIIGLIVGGITVGDAMITNSKMRSVAVEKDRLTKATRMFQDKYYSLPGDMKNAETLWAPVPSSGCPWGARSGNQTCNGNGDGKVDEDGAASPNQTRELFTFWQHMSIAGIMEESFTGIKGTGAFSFTSGTNVPESAWTKAAGWNVRYVGIKADATYYDGSYGHILMLGDTGFDSTSNGVMTPDEQMSLDKKFDDSFPHTGNIRSAKATFVGACVTGTAPNFTYNIASKDSVCAPIWISGF